MKKLRFKVEDRFGITGRGTALVIKEDTDFPVAKCLRATVFRPDGSEFSAEALEKEALVLPGIKKKDTPDGCFVDIAAPKSLEKK